MDKETAKKLAELGARIDRFEKEMLRFLPLQPPPIPSDQSEPFDIEAICEKMRQEDEAKALDEPPR